MKQLIERTKIIWLLVLATALFIGCEDDDDTILPELVASFAHTINEDTGGVSFINLSENADSYTWDFGDGRTSTEINPIRSFPTGTYTIMLTAKNAAGALGTFEDEIVINIPLPVNFPITFDDVNVNYDVTTFNGASFEIVDNPDASGTNTSNSKVGGITNSGAAFEGLFFDLGMPIDLATLKSIKANFWSDAPIDILMKLEEGTGADVETTASHGGTGWEEIRFDFGSDAKYSRVTLFVDGPGTTSGTFYIDDIMQTETPEPVGPQTAAPAPPTRDAADVKSLFSNAYDNITVSEWSTSWDDADIEDVTADGDDVKKITFGSNGGFLGVDFSANAFDATTFTHFHMDYWVADDITSGQILNPKWSNHANGAEVNAFEYTNPVSESGQWVSIDIPVTDFTGDTTRDNLAQFIIAAANTIGEAYVDNIYFYKEAGSSATAPTTAAPAPPTRDAADVKSLFSNAYDNVTVSEWSTSWDDADIEDTTADGDDVKKVTFGDNGGFLGVDFSASAFDATAFTHFHMDYWVADAITSGQVLNPKWSNHANGAEVNAFEYTNPVSESGQWVSVDIPITDFTIGDTTRDNLAQFILATANSLDEVYIDNIYFYKEAGTGGGGSNSTVLLDFENNLTGVTASEFETSGALVSNPASGGINTSANVYEAGYTNGNQWWGGVGFVLDSGLDQATTVYKAKFYSTVAPTNVLFQVEVDGTNAPVGDVQTIDTANEWVELTFTLANIPAGVNRILVRPDVGNQDGTKPNTGSLYFDDIEEVDGGSGGNTGGGNTDVVSILHDDFTDIAINAWGPDWGPSSARIVDGTLNGSAAKVINMEAEKVFAGIDFAPSAFDATDFTTFHIVYQVDVLLPGQVFNIKLSNHEGGSGETSAIQYTHTPTSTDVNKLSIPLADFVDASDPANLTRNAIAQIVITAARADINQGVNITIDNIYFSK